MNSIIVLHPDDPTPAIVRLGYPSEPWGFALPGDTLTLRADGPRITAVDVIAAPEGAEPTIDLDGLPLAQVTIAGTGRHHLRVTVETGETADISIIAVEPGCLDKIRTNDALHLASVDKRRVLRELARYTPAFDGTIADLLTRNLTAFGAA